MHMTVALAHNRPVQGKHQGVVKDTGCEYGRPRISSNVKLRPEPYRKWRIKSDGFG